MIDKNTIIEILQKHPNGLKAKDIALEQMSTECKEYIETNYGSIDAWLTTQIEATINILKNK